MSRQAALRAYHRYLQDDARYEFAENTGEYTIPLVGWMKPAVKGLINDIAMPFKVAKAYVFGGDARPITEDCAMPAMPKHIKEGEPLHAALTEKWKLQKDMVASEAKTAEHVLKGELISAYQENAKADFAQMRKNIVLPQTPRVLPELSGVAALAALKLGSKLLSSGVSAPAFSNFNTLMPPAAGTDLSAAVSGLKDIIGGAVGSFA